MARNVTIREIARAAGVSVSTVSRVVNDNYPVSQEVKDRVNQVMEQLHYQPNAIAQSLRSSRSNMIGLIVADLSNQFFTNAMKGLEKVVANKGYSLVVASSDGKPEKERQLIRAMTNKRLDALCIASVDTQPDTINEAIQGGTPIVLMDRELEGIETSQVCWNDAESARILTNLLLENGHRDIAIVNVTLTHSVGRNRLNAFRETVNNAGIALPKGFISPSCFSSDEAYRYVMKIMNGKRRPTALLCANNVMAAGALKALMELGLKIYDDVSMVSFGSLEWNHFMKPQITNMELNSCEMGERAGAIMADMIERQQGLATRVVLSGRLVLGESVRRI